MNITTTIDGERADMAIIGRFDAHETDNFRTRFDELVAGGAVRASPAGRGRRRHGARRRLRNSFGLPFPANDR